MAYGLLLLRVVVGGTMAAHGSQKRFGWFGGPGLEGAAGFFGQLRFRSPHRIALLAALAELGGALLALGLLTPPAALGIAVAVAISAATIALRRPARPAAPAARTEPQRPRKA